MSHQTWSEMEAAHRDHVEKLRERGTVLEYSYDTPVKAADVEQALKLAKLAFLSRREPDLLELPDEECRRILVEREPLLGTFGQTHPTIFRNMTSKEVGPRSFEVLRGLATYEKECGHLPEALRRSRVSEYLQRQLQ